MADLYYEELIKRKSKQSEKLFKVAMMVLTAVFAVLSLLSFNLIFIIPTIVAIVVDFLVVPRMDIEWEYQYVNGELDIDKIMSKSKRKRVKSYEVTNAEIIAPAKSHRLDYYNNNSQLKVLDFSSNDPEREKQVYAMIVADEQQTNKVLFEPTMNMLKDMRLKAPRKVFFD